jgi:hypothetical protein
MYTSVVIKTDADDGPVSEFGLDQTTILNDGLSRPSPRPYPSFLNLGHALHPPIANRLSTPSSLN